MGATTYIVIDNSEKRVVKAHYRYLDGFLAALAANPMTVDEFNAVHEEDQGYRFFTEGNRPKVPEQLSPSDIRRVLGMESRATDEVMDYWKKTSFHIDPNYERAYPDQKTDYDIPENNTDESEVEKRKKLALNVNVVEVNVGYSLIELADTYQGGDFIERINVIRYDMKAKSGFVLPPVRVRDNMKLCGINEYIFKINGVEAARGSVNPHKLLAMDAGLVNETIEGINTTEPYAGYPAVWIDKDERDCAEARGYVVVSASAVMATHLAKVLREHIEEIMSSPKSDCEIPEAKHLFEDGTIEADLRTKTLRYITDGAFKIDSQLIPDWTVVVE